MSTFVGLRPGVAQPATTVSKGRLTAADRTAHDWSAEQYRALRHIVEQFGKADKRVIAISSPIAGDGKTITSINLAKALSQSADARVLLIDADLRRGSVSEYFGIGKNAGPGFSGVIAERSARLSTAVRRPPGSTLDVVPSGACPPDPYETLRSSRVGELLHEARITHDYIVIDTAPVVPVADMRALSQWVDGFLLVISAHRTPRALFDEALQAMEPEKVLGIVYNGDDLPIARRHRYYYSYGQPAPTGLLTSVLGGGPRR